MCSSRSSRSLLQAPGQVEMLTLWEQVCQDILSLHFRTMLKPFPWSLLHLREHCR